MSRTTAPGAPRAGTLLVITGTIALIGGLLLPGASQATSPWEDFDPLSGGTGSEFGDGEWKTKTPHPTKTHTHHPTKSPTDKPTDHPTKTHTHHPTKSPTDKPTKTHSPHPTKSPTETPTDTPSTPPTKSPTETPSTDGPETDTPPVHHDVPPDDEQRLPTTGAPSGVVAAAGATALLAGLLVLWRTRRDRPAG
ncbi:LPXTG-motif cell wall-anchored protein [Stackebrandtia albiflava]|uniref:LPXTG-motif cell wall-anchored protein n=1 Tax=Stackebrandtia albiflava TaxID=406432 RepID=A0A562UQM1_9ACTN|nr:LPXTG cell wall anchor domain-containing protein [Stackebrandtia albiflava]TWJ07911.1 LPXTG-motif cell wall-anchored protein [Stackebrandtia albiflava]